MIVACSTGKVRLIKNDEKYLCLFVMLTIYGVNDEGVIALGLKRVKFTYGFNYEDGLFVW